MSTISRSRWILVGILIFSCTATIRADEKSRERSKIATQLERARQRLTESEKYLLEYKFKKGEEIRAQVTFKSSMDTKIRGTRELAETSTNSVRVWRVESIDEAGNMTLTHSIDAVEMWNKIGDRPEVRYNSEKDDKPPVEFESVAKTVGVPLATITMAKTGKVAFRNDKQGEFSSGTGELTILLPHRAISVGEQWTITDEVKVPLEVNSKVQIQRIKLRHVYVLKEVEDGVATITESTQILTPITNTAIEAKLAQRLKEGTIKFDIERGRVTFRELTFDKTVINFSGAGSIMRYLAKRTETLVDGSTETETEPEDSDEEGRTARLNRDGDPELRR